MSRPAADKIADDARPGTRASVTSIAVSIMERVNPFYAKTVVAKVAPLCSFQPFGKMIAASA
jgi:hypothetical protein